MSETHFPADLEVDRIAPETGAFADDSGDAYRIRPGEGFKFSATQDRKRIADRRSRLTERPKTVHGKKGGEVSCPVLMRSPATQLVTGASDPTVPGPMGAVLKAAMGGWDANPGSTTQSSSNASLVKVGTGHGARFKVGAAIAVEVAGELEITFVTAKATDDLTVAPALSGTPTTGGKVVNSHWFYLKNSSRETVSFLAAKASDVAGVTSFQWSLNGCYATGFALNTKTEELVELAVTFAVSTWTGPSAQSQDTSDAAETDQSEAFMYLDTQLWVYPVGSPSRTHVTHHAFNAGFDPGMVPIGDAGSGGGNAPKSGRCGAIRTKPPMAFMDLGVPADIGWETVYTGQSDYGIVSIMKQGSGTTARFTVVASHGAYLEQEPEPAAEDNRYTENLHFELRETSSTSWTSSDDAQRSPLSIFQL